MVAIVLFVFLMNVRATVISLAAIPISILITVLVFRAFGLTINTMTLGGLGDRDRRTGRRRGGRRREHPAAAARRTARLPNPRPVLEVVAAASQEVRSGIIYATMIIVLVFVPLFALSGHRRPAVRAARRRLHRLDLRVAGDLDHGDAGACLLPAGRQRPTRHEARQLRGAASQARQRRAAAVGVRSPRGGVRVGRRRGRRRRHRGRS